MGKDIAAGEKKGQRAGLWCQFPLELCELGHLGEKTVVLRAVCPKDGNVSSCFPSEHQQNPVRSASNRERTGVHVFSLSHMQIISKKVEEFGFSRS